MKESDVISAEYQDKLNCLLTFGLSEAVRGNIPAATEAYLRISRLELLHESDFRRAGTLASLVGKHENAIAFIRTAVGLAPDNHETWTVLGDAYCNSGNVEQGIKAYRNAQDVNPAVILPGLAQAFDLSGMHDQADYELARIARSRFGSNSGNNTDCKAALFLACLPKSAGSSICRAIEQCTGITQGGIVAITDRDYFPNARISPEAFFTTIRNPVQLHTHIRATASNLTALTGSGLERLLVHIRDPRQAFVSYYFHSKNAMGLIRSRYANPEFDSLDDQERFRWFMEFYYPRFINWIIEWVRVESGLPGYSFSLLITTFEDMLKLGQARLVKDILDFYGIIPNTTPVEQKRRLRKGSADEWRSVIPESYHASLWEMIPPVLIERFGWDP
ncbi:MAG: hypothetical protein BMS9Abin09_0525 [Gammaproteobacteria bacterium]|nr:MAG: hypothetical protein BMS9Abin09_0525 [Gammaproteobacteria bacterium]